jgi:hypothetical protein
VFLDRRRLQTALGRWHAIDRPRIQLNGHAQRASKGLEDRFALMVAINTAQVINV